MPVKAPWMAGASRARLGGASIREAGKRAARHAGIEPQLVAEGEHLRVDGGVRVGVTSMAPRRLEGVFQ